MHFAFESSSRRLSMHMKHTAEGLILTMLNYIYGYRGPVDTVFAYKNVHHRKIIPLVRSIKI